MNNEKKPEINNYLLQCLLYWREKAQRKQISRVFITMTEFSANKLET